MAFSAEFRDYSFCFGVGFITPKAFAPTNDRLLAAAKESGRDALRTKSISLYTFVINIIFVSNNFQ
jgi:hypothetical protein